MAEDTRDYVPPPSNAGIRDPGGNATTTAVTSPPSINRYAPVYLTPKMFGLTNWRQVEAGLSSTQVNAIYDWLSKIDRPTSVNRYSMGNFGPNMLRQARNRVMTELPAPVTETTQPVTDPNAITPDETGQGPTYDPRKDPDYGGNTYVPPPVVGGGGSGGDVVGGKGPGPATSTYIQTQVGPNRDPVVAQEPGEWIAGKFYAYSKYSMQTLDFLKKQLAGEAATPEARPEQPTVTPDPANDMPTVDWQTQLPDKWKGLANNGKANPNWWKSYFDYDATQRRFTPNAKVGSRLGFTAFTVPSIGGGQGPYVPKPQTRKVMY